MYKNSLLYDLRYALLAVAVHIERHAVELIHPLLVWLLDCISPLGADRWHAVAMAYFSAFAHCAR